MENNQSDGKTNLTSEENLLNAALIFANALSHVLSEEQGIIVDVKEGMKVPNSKKVIVYFRDGLINISPFEGDFEEGTFVDIQSNQ